jgi:hypothetical protein
MVALATESVEELASLELEKALLIMITVVTDTMLLLWLQSAQTSILDTLLQLYPRR